MRGSCRRRSSTGDTPQCFLISVANNLHKLVIVGQQSAGKSSLLKSLTDVPFPAGDGLCTRFVTRIISKRSAPDTLDEVKVSIEPGEFEHDAGHHASGKREVFNPHVSSMTPDVFKRIFEQVRKTQSSKATAKTSRQAITWVCRLAMDEGRRERTSQVTYSVSSYTDRIELILESWTCRESSMRRQTQSAKKICEKSKPWSYGI